MTWHYIGKMTVDELRSFITTWGAFFKRVPLYAELPDGETVRIA